MGQVLDQDDMIFHMLIVGGTGSGKTNAILYMLDLLFQREKQEKVPAALFLFDPAGDASIDLMRAIPESEWARIVILDPQYVSFGFNPLSLPKDIDPVDRPEVLQIQVEEFSALLSDVFNTDAANAPRLMWIFKGALYYLYTFDDSPTFWDLYNIMLDFTSKSHREVENILRARGLRHEIIQGTIEAISKLPPDAYPPVINRISNFVLPPDSITFRTFCSRESKIDLEKQMEAGSLTIIRIPGSLPGEFKKLLASAIVMKLYFSVLKRARRLERLGEPPTARTPVILAADEFRDVSELKTLSTVLSQSRKFALYLWMVVQTLSELPENLTGSIQANVGPMLVFRSGTDDAKRLSKLLYPERASAVETLIPGLEDYACLARKRPVGGRPVEPPFRVTFPKLRDPVHQYRTVLSFMKVQMEQRYGGAVGDRRVVYKKSEEAAEATGECPLEGPAQWVSLLYLHFNGPDVPFKHLSEIFEKRYGWNASILQTSLNKLVATGRAKDRAQPGQLYKGIDPQTGQAMWKEPESNDEKMRARDVHYSTTPLAEKQFFELEMDSTRVGGPLHVMAVRKLLDQYWRIGYWCFYDRGKRREELPDIILTEPVIEHVKGKEGKQNETWSPTDWDVRKRIAVEVETNPSKSFDQIRTNYEKGACSYWKTRFVVVSATQVEEVYRVLQDKDQQAFEVVYLDLGLDERELAKMIAEEETAVDSAPRLQKNELWILAKICLTGYSNRVILASSLSVTERQVTRYLDNLETNGMLERMGNAYRPTEKGHRLVEQGGWTSATLPVRPDDVDSDEARPS